MSKPAALSPSEDNILQRVIQNAKSEKLTFQSFHTQMNFEIPDNIITTFKYMPYISFGVKPTQEMQKEIITYCLEGMQSPHVLP